jgi:hypothetical protein
VFSSKSPPHPDAPVPVPYRMSSRLLPGQAEYACRCDRCDGKVVSKTTFYNHGNRIRRKLSQRTKDRILRLPETSTAPRTRRPWNRRSNRHRSTSSDGDPTRLSNRAEARSHSVRMIIDISVYASKSNKYMFKMFPWVLGVLRTVARLQE